MSARVISTPLPSTSLFEAYHTDRGLVKLNH